MSIFYSNHVNPFSRQLGLSLFQSFSTKKKEKKNLRTLFWSLILLFLYFFEMSNIRTDWRHLYVGPTKCKSKITTVMGLDSDNVISVFYGEKIPNMRVRGHRTGETSGTRFLWSNVLTSSHYHIILCHCIGGWIAKLSLHGYSKSFNFYFILFYFLLVLQIPKNYLQVKFYLQQLLLLLLLLFFQ